MDTTPALDLSEDPPVTNAPLPTATIPSASSIAHSEIPSTSTIACSTDTTATEAPTASSVVVTDLLTVPNMDTGELLMLTDGSRKRAASGEPASGSPKRQATEDSCQLINIEVCTAPPASVHHELQPQLVSTASHTDSSASQVVKSTSQVPSTAAAGVVSFGPKRPVEERSVDLAALSVRITFTAIDYESRVALKDLCLQLPDCEVIESVEQATHLVCNRLIRTPKTYLAVAFGCYLVTPKWIQASVLRGCWLGKGRRIYLLLTLMRSSDHAF